MRAGRGAREPHPLPPVERLAPGKDVRRRRVELIRRRCAAIDQPRIARIMRSPDLPPKEERRPSDRMVAVQSMIDHDPELRFLREVLSDQR